MNFSWKLFAFCVALLGVLDFFWLGFVANSFYLQQLSALGRIENDKFVPVVWSAVLVYLLMAAALQGFALPRVGPNDPWYSAAIWGAFLGFCLYGFYDFTNHATLKGWPEPFMAADIFWGTLQFGITNTALFFLREKLA